MGQPQRPQLDRGASGLGERAGIRSRDKHHGRLLRVGQRRHRGLKARLLHLQARVRPEAGCASIVVGEEPGPGLGQAQQAQRVTGRRGVEHDVVVAGRVGPAFGPAFGIDFEQRGEFVERGDLGGAGAGELFAHGCALRERALRLHLGEHAVAIGFGGVVGVDVQHRETGGAGYGDRRVAQRDAHHLVEVGGRVGAHQQHAFSGVGERERGRRGQGGLADAAFAGEEQVAGGVRQQGGDERGGVHAEDVPRRAPERSRRLRDLRCRLGP